MSWFNNYSCDISTGLKPITFVSFQIIARVKGFLDPLLSAHPSLSSYEEGIQKIQILVHDIISLRNFIEHPYINKKKISAILVRHFKNLYGSMGQLPHEECSNNQFYICIRKSLENIKATDRYIPKKV